MRHSFLFGLALAVALTAALAWPATAQASILTFGITGLNIYDDLPTTYGDNINSLTVGSFSDGLGNGFTPDITVDYRTLEVGSPGRWHDAPQQPRLVEQQLR